MEFDARGLRGCLVNHENLQSRKGRIKDGDVQGVAVPEASRVEALTVMIHAHGAIDDLVLAVAIHVGNAQTMGTLAFVGPVRLAVLAVAGTALSKTQCWVSLPSRQSQAASTERV